MSITVTSTTDTPEAILAAQGGQTSKEVEGDKSASDKTQSEEISKTSDASGESSSDKEQELDASKGDESDEDADDEGDERPRRKNGFKRRIDKLNKRISDKDREVEYWKAQATKDQSKEKTESIKPPEPKADASSKPKSEDFESHDDYVEALVDWKADQKIAAQKAKEQESKVRSEFDSRINQHLSKLETFKAEHDDFDDVIELVEDVPISIAVHELILESDNGPKLMYELAKNKEEYARICKLTPLAAAREMGKFEAKISSQSESSKEKGEIKKTKAPPPISPVTSKGGGQSAKSPDEMSYQEYKKWREQNL